jgi:hypothetical protein
MHEAETPPEGDYEHICLSAEDSLEPEEATVRTPSRIEAELRQQRRGRTESALIFDGRYLGVRTEGPGAGPCWYWLHLAFVDPQPIRRAERLRRAVVAALVAPAGGALLAVAVAGSLSGPTAAVALPAAALLSLAGLACATFDYLDQWVFCTRHGRVPVLRVARLRAERRGLRRFLDRLEDGADAAWRQAAGARAALLRDEMRAHRRLLQEGVLAQREFDAARAAILRAHD